MLNQKIEVEIPSVKVFLSIGDEAGKAVVKNHYLGLMSSPPQAGDVISIRINHVNHIVKVKFVIWTFGGSHKSVEVRAFYPDVTPKELVSRQWEELSNVLESIYADMVSRPDELAEEDLGRLNRIKTSLEAVGIDLSCYKVDYDEVGRPVKIEDQQ